MRKKLLKQFLLLGTVALGLAFAKPAHAAAGSLDPTFGHGGVAVTTLTTAGGANGVIPYVVQMQSDGKILVVADVTNGSAVTTDVLRYTSSGALDTTFGTNGIAVLPATLSPAFLALQSNGQIVVAGIGGSEFSVERLNTNGSMDSSFGNDGVASASLGGNTPAIQLVALITTSGDILVAGQLQHIIGGSDKVLLARFTSAGALDASFGSNGTTITTAVSGCTALAELSSGSYMVINGQGFVQFSSTGSDESAKGGSVAASSGSPFLSAPNAVQSNGDYLFAETQFVGKTTAHNAAVAVQRYTYTETTDSSFAAPTFHYAGTGGSGIEATANAMAIQPSGKIVIVGSQSTLTQTGATIVNGIARLTSGGLLDSSFGTNGAVTNSVPAGTQGLVAVTSQVDGNIVAVGLANSSAALTVSRYLGQ